MNLTPANVRQRAYTATWKAIRNGDLVKPALCEDCGLPKPLVAHHRDYTNPTDIAWLCGSCHKNAHIEAGEVFHWRTGKPISRRPRKAKS